MDSFVFPLSLVPATRRIFKKYCIKWNNDSHYSYKKCCRVITAMTKHDDQTQVEEPGGRN